MCVCVYLDFFFFFGPSNAPSICLYINTVSYVTEQRQLLGAFGSVVLKFTIRDQNKEGAALQC